MRWKVILGLVLAAFAAFGMGCNTTPPPPTSTLRVLPSFTPSDTLTITLTPSLTLTLTPTPTATSTPRPTFTPSFTPSRTATPTATLTPSLTRTPTPLPTDTPTLTPPPTATSTPSETPRNLPRILSLEASPLTVPPGGSVIVTWQADADRARINLYDSADALEATISAPITGQQGLIIPETFRDFARIELVAYRGEDSAAQSVTVTIGCATPWFFQKAEMPEGCPASPAQTGQAHLLPFERGWMIYFMPANQVYVIANNDQKQWAKYEAAWTEATPIGPLSPPAGRFQPQNQMGWIFLNEPFMSQPWSAFLGWAITDEPVVYQASRQVEANTAQPTYYVNTPDGSVFKLVEGGQWQIVP
jgi:hypothetical protein